MLYWTNKKNGRSFAVVLSRDPFDYQPLLYIYKSGECIGCAPRIERPKNLMQRIREIRLARKRHGYILKFIRRESVKRQSF